MKLSKHRRLLLPLSVLIALVLVLISAGYHHRRNREYNSAIANLDDCQELAKQIKLLREKPTKATDKAETTSRISKLLEETAAQYGVASEQIVRISPSRPQRISQTDYEEQPTLVEIRNVKLDQLVQLLAKTKESNLNLAGLRISAPRQLEPNSAEVWNVEATISQLIYRPRDNR